MASKRMKMEDVPEEHHEQNISVDRLSDLPDYIIHHILSLVPTSVVIKTTLLSRRWRYIWASVPAIDMSDHWSSSKMRSKTLLGSYLEHHKKYSPDKDLFLTRFKLKLKYYGSYRHIDCWLSQCIQSSLRELDLCIEPQSMSRFYCLLQSMLQLARSLSVLKLQWMMLVGLPSVSFPALVTLSLEDMQMDDNTIHSLILACPNIKNLLISSNRGGSDIHISSSSLMSFRIEHVSYHRIHVEASNLLSFAYRGYSKSIITLANCESLRDLKLRGARFNDKWLEDLIPRLPLLESLTLDDCNGFEELKFFSQNLKCFTLRNYYAILYATINTPSLLSLNYWGYVPHKFSMSVGNHVEPDILVRSNIYNKEWYSNLVNFLRNFDCCRCLTLYVHTEKVCVFLYYIFFTPYLIIWSL